MSGGKRGFAAVAGRGVSACLALLAAGAVGCSGGGEDGVADGGVFGDGSGSTTYAVDFVPSEPSPQTGDVAMSAASGSGTLHVDVTLTDTPGLASATMDITFDPTRVEFVSWSEGDLFDPCGSGSACLIQPQTGRVVIGISQLGGGTVDALGTATVVRLAFRATAPGDSELAFDRMALSDPDLVDLGGIDWFGGSMQAQ